jgi:hypothetical protein
MRVLLAIDGSTHSDAAVAAVAGRPWPEGTNIRVLTVVHATAPLVLDPAFVLAAIHVEQTKELMQHARISSRRRRNRSCVGHQDSTCPPRSWRACQRT